MRSIRLSRKINVAIVLTTILYSCETWTTCHHQIEQLKQFQESSNVEVVKFCSVLNVESKCQSALLLPFLPPWDTSSAIITLTCPSQLIVINLQVHKHLWFTPLLPGHLCSMLTASASPLDEKNGGREEKTKKSKQQASEALWNIWTSYTVNCFRALKLLKPIFMMASAGHFQSMTFCWCVLWNNQKW